VHKAWSTGYDLESDNGGWVLNKLWSAHEKQNKYWESTFFRNFFQMMLSTPRFLGAKIALSESRYESMKWIWCSPLRAVWESIRCIFAALKALHLATFWSWLSFSQDFLFLATPFWFQSSPLLLEIPFLIGILVAYVLHSQYLLLQVWDNRYMLALFVHFDLHTVEACSRFESLMVSS